MSRVTLLRLIVSCIGLCLSAAALGIGQADVAPGPFGFPVLVWVHLLAAWPAAWGVAELFVYGKQANLVAGRISYAVGIALAALVFAGGESAWRDLMDGRPTTFAFGWLAREIVALALLVPWCVAAHCLFSDPVKANAESFSTAWSFVASAALAFVAVPAVFADYHFRQQTARLETQYEQGRLVGLRLLTRQLLAAGSHAPVGDMSIERFDLKLMDHVTAFSNAEPLPANASPAMIVGRAAQLAALGDTQGATELLAPLATNNAAAALLMGSVLDDLGNHQSAAERFRAAIKLLESDATPNAVAVRVQAFDSLAETLRDQHQYAAAEQTYVDAIKAVPVAEAHFRFQLGRHYALGGRSLAALKSFEKAAELAPDQFALDRPEVQEQVRPLREATPGCLLPSSFYNTNPKR